MIEALMIGGSIFAVAVMVWATIDILRTEHEIEEIDMEIRELEKRKSDLDNIILMDVLNRLHALEEKNGTR